MLRSNLAKILTTGPHFGMASCQNFGGGPKHTLAPPLKFLGGGAMAPLGSATPAAPKFLVSVDWEG